MMLASNLAGKAINISRTTAAHALSYKITSEYGIPHGHAVALTIKNVFDFNLKTQNKNTKYLIYKLKDFLSNDIYAYYQNLFKQINLTTNIVNFDAEMVASNVNLERLKNNPRNLTQEDLIAILSDIKIQNNTNKWS